MTTEPHLIPVVTDRGFTHMPSVQGTYGELVRVYESSAASQPCIWLRIVGGQHDEWAAHLPVEAALRLAEQIQHLARNHYQLREDVTA
jgi:hypothetical protein